MFKKQTFKSSKSNSFDLLKQELKDKDELISALKHKLEIIESFNCSSSSFDALNSFQDRRNSSVVVIEENDSIPSPTFKPLLNEITNRSNMLSRREKIDNNLALKHCSSQSLLNSSPTSSGNNAKFPSCKSTSILPSFKQIFTNPFSPRKNSEDADYDSKNKVNFFKRIFFRKQECHDDVLVDTAETHPTNFVCSNESFYESSEELDFSYSYDAIVSGKIDIDSIHIDRIEKYLNWNDCIEWLGITKEQCKLIRASSLEMRKRSVFLCPDQLKFYSKEK